MILSDEVLHNCLTAVANEGRVPTYYLWSYDIDSSQVQDWLVESKLIRLKSEVMWITKLLKSDWTKRCPTLVKVPKLTFKGLWKIWVLRYNNPQYDVDFIDWDDIRQ